jgi:hypothetical protein
MIGKAGMLHRSIAHKAPQDIVTALALICKNDTLSFGDVGN